jgi:hypothetical protein
MMSRLAWLAMAGLLWIAPAIAQTAFTPRDESRRISPRAIAEVAPCAAQLLSRRKNIPCH